MASIKPIKKIIIRKNQGFEALFIALIILFAFALVFLIINKAWKSMRPELESGLSSAIPQNSGYNISETLDKTSSSTSSFGKLIPFLIIGLFAFVMILGGTIMRSPIMIIVGIIVLGIIITLSVIYSNVYSEISDSDSFSDVKSDSAIQNKFMQYLPVIVFLLALAIALAALWLRSGGSSGL